MCTALVAGNMIGSGVFLLPSSLAPYGGISLFGWLFTAVGAMLVALVFAKLSRLMPMAGGPYAYTRRGFGELAGFLMAWGYWISIMIGNAAIATAFAGYLGFFFPDVAHTPAFAALTALAAIWILTWINTKGIREAGIVQLITTVLKIVPLLAMATLGLTYFNLEHFVPLNLSGESTLSAITATAALTLWALTGLESATIPSDQISEPERNIPRSTLLGTGLTAVVYILSSAAVMGVVPPAQLMNSTAPYADAATAMWGGWAGHLIAGGATIACFGALNGWILLQGQVPLATARDGLFPAIFGRVNVDGTPVAGLVISSVVVTILMAMNYTKGLVALFTFAILLATLTTLLPYVFSTMAELMIFINEREHFNPQKMLGSTIIAVLAFLYSMWAIAGTGHESLYWGFLLLLAGLPVFVWLKWRQSILKS